MYVWVNIWNKFYLCIIIIIIIITTITTTHIKKSNFLWRSTAVGVDFDGNKTKYIFKVIEKNTIFKNVLQANLKWISAVWDIIKGFLN